MDYLEIVEHMLSFDDVTRRQCYTVTIQDDDISESVEDFFVAYSPPPGSRVNIIPSMTAVRIRETSCK